LFYRGDNYSDAGGLHSYLENGGGVRAGVIVESPKLGVSVTLLLSLPLATP
jgi:hypothetical protein